MTFSTQEADNEYETKFVTPLRLVLGGNNAAAGEVYKKLGQFWADTRVSLEGLPHENAHTPEPDSSLACDLKEAVLRTLEDEWRALSPKINSADGKTSHMLYRRVTAVESAYQASFKLRLAHAAEANEPTPISISTPEPKRDNENGDDLIDTMVSRMQSVMQESGNGCGPAPSAGGRTQAPETKEESRQGGVVPPQLQRGCKWILEVGVPPLRVAERFAPKLATNILSQSATFTVYVEKSTLKGSQMREALTLARMLDLATEEYGPKYLLSNAAEVGLRRLVSIMIAAKMGDFTLAQVLEEIPTDTAFSVVPEEVLTSMYQRIKLEGRLASRVSGLSQRDP